MLKQTHAHQTIPRKTGFGINTPRARSVANLHLDRELLDQALWADFPCRSNWRIGATDSGGRGIDFHGGN